MREGNLEAPTRHAIDWKNPGFYDQAACEKEMERIFDICHGCRRCVSLCNAFPKRSISSTSRPTRKPPACPSRSTGRWSTSATCATSAT
jgi:hypothetical protein